MPLTVELWNTYLTGTYIGILYLLKFLIMGNPFVQETSHWDSRFHKTEKSCLKGLKTCLPSRCHAYLLSCSVVSDCDHMDCSLPDSSVSEIVQARILECIAISSFWRSSLPKDWTWFSCCSCIGRWILYHWATLEIPSRFFTSINK